MTTNAEQLPEPKRQSPPAVLQELKRELAYIAEHHLPATEHTPEKIVRKTLELFRDHFAQAYQSGYHPGIHLHEGNVTLPIAMEPLLKENHAQESIHDFISGEPQDLEAIDQVIAEIRETYKGESTTTILNNAIVYVREATILVDYKAGEIVWIPQEGRDFQNTKSTQITFLTEEEKESSRNIGAGI